MKKKICAFLLTATMAVVSVATPLTVCDFENYPIGTEWKLWQSNGGSITSTAIVEADPTNPDNKVLHIVLKDWGCHPEFIINSTLRGNELTDRYGSIRYRLYRSATDIDNWKQFAAFIGDTEVYRDEGYPQQGNNNEWQVKTYTMKGLSPDNVSDKLRLGIHHANSDFYIDDIQLVGTYDDFVSVEDNGTFDYCVDNTASSYRNISDNIYISAGQIANVLTSRYSEWTGKLAGEGTLKIHAGGERSYLGTSASKGTTTPDWSGFKGSIELYPYKDVNSSCGFYGLVMSSGTFQPDNLAASNCNNLLADKTLIMKDGTMLALESGTRGVRIGEIHSSKNSWLGGYYKKGTANSYYVIGGKGTDGVLGSLIAPQASGNKVGILKEGIGNYYLTGNENDINGGLCVLQGGIIVANDKEVALQKNLSGATGNSSTVMVYHRATLCGNGNIAAATEVYGTLTGGDPFTLDQALGTLTFADYTKAALAVKVTLHPEANIIACIKDAKNFSAIDIKGTLVFSTITEDFETSDKQPRLKIALTEDAELHVGDEIVLLSAMKEDVDSWDFDIRYPKSYTWVVDEREAEDGRFCVVAKVTSLAYSGQGDQEDDDEPDDGETVYPDDDWVEDMDMTTSLRFYAEKLGKNIGVAAASYRYDFSQTNGEIGLVGEEFNMIVGENEMKFDATEPNQGEFNYGGSDAILWLSDRYEQVVRGHTLAWHQQVPSWVSSDGKKNNNNFSKRQLLDILKNHIFNVVGRYKGKITEWDVCNEVLDDDQSIVRSDPTAYKLRPSIWATYIGEEFIDSAFVWAHQADPDAKLYINEYGAEMVGKTKTEAYYNLVKRLKESGLAIEGCGLQCHFTTGELDTMKLEKNIRRYDNLGLKCIITELDIALADPTAEDALERQAKEYGAITRIFLRNENCSSMLVWGISDNHSWRKNAPLLFNHELKAKPAYYNVHAQLRKAVEQLSTGLESPKTDGKPSARLLRTVYYNIMGQEMTSPTGFRIERRFYDDGSIETIKTYK